MAQDEKHLLIVEDSPDLQILLAQMLKGQGYVISKAFNGQEALQLLRTMPKLPSLILLDIMMPVMDGFAFRKEQQEDPRLALIPVIVMTAGSDLDIKAKQMHVTEILRKPIDFKKLLDVAAKVSA